MRWNTYSADFLDEEVHQYLVEQYVLHRGQFENSFLRIALILLALCALPGTGIVMSMFPMLFSESGINSLKKTLSYLIPVILSVAMVIGVLLILHWLVSKNPKTNVNKLKAKNYMYHIGTVTGKKAERLGDYVKGNAPYNHTDYYLYLDGKKFIGRYLMPDDYKLAQKGDKYILVFLDGRELFCTRIQDVAAEFYPVDTGR